MTGTAAKPHLLRRQPQFSSRPSLTLILWGDVATWWRVFWLSPLTPEPLPPSIMLSFQGPAAPQLEETVGIESTVWPKTKRSPKNAHATEQGRPLGTSHRPIGVCRKKTVRLAASGLAGGLANKGKKSFVVFFLGTPARRLCGEKGFPRRDAVFLLSFPGKKNSLVRVLWRRGGVFSATFWSRKPSRRDTGTPAVSRASKADSDAEDCRWWPRRRTTRARRPKTVVSRETRRQFQNRQPEARSGPP